MTAWGRANRTRLYRSADVTTSASPTTAVPSRIFEIVPWSEIPAQCKLCVIALLRSLDTRRNRRRPVRLSLTAVALPNYNKSISDGISEDIITDPSKLPELHVIARNSSFVYKRAAISVPDVTSTTCRKQRAQGGQPGSGHRAIDRFERISSAVSKASARPG